MRSAGPMWVSSRKRTSTCDDAALRSASSFSSVISSLQARMTSPVFGSFTSCAETRPSTSSTRIGIWSMPACSIWRSTSFVNLRPSLTMQLVRLRVGGCRASAFTPTRCSGLKSFAALRPSRTIVSLR